MCKGLSKSPRQAMCVSEKNFQAVVKGNELKALISYHATPASPFLLRYSLSCNHNCFSFVFFFFKLNLCPSEEDC